MSDTEEVKASLSIEKKKIPKTMGIFKYSNKSKKGSSSLFFFSSSEYFSLLFLTNISSKGIKINVKIMAEQLARLLVDYLVLLEGKTQEVLLQVLL